MLVIREAAASDAPLIVEMIRELADFEGALDQVDSTPEDLVRHGFRENPGFHAFVAEWDGQPAAYILYFFTYSTWAGRPSLFVEDLFVRARFRRKGIGTALLKRMAVIARETNCYGVRWEVLNVELRCNRLLPFARRQSAVTVVASTAHGQCLRETGIAEQQRRLIRFRYQAVSTYCHLYVCK